MLSVFMLNVADDSFMISVIVSYVIMLSVMAPKRYYGCAM